MKQVTVKIGNIDTVVTVVDSNQRNRFLLLMILKWIQEQKKLFRLPFKKLKFAINLLPDMIPLQKL